MIKDSPSPLDPPTAISRSKLDFLEPLRSFFLRFLRTVAVSSFEFNSVTSFLEITDFFCSFRDHPYSLVLIDSFFI